MKNDFEVRILENEMWGVTVEILIEETLEIWNAANQQNCNYLTK